MFKVEHCQLHAGGTDSMVTHVRSTLLFHWLMHTAKTENKSKRQIWKQASNTLPPWYADFAGVSFCYNHCYIHASNKHTSHSLTHFAFCQVLREQKYWLCTFRFQLCFNSVEFHQLTQTVVIITVILLRFIFFVQSTKITNSSCMYINEKRKNIK